jgi:hypothetical protein
MSSSQYVSQATRFAAKSAGPACRRTFLLVGLRGEVRSGPNWRPGPR